MASQNTVDQHHSCHAGKPTFATAAQHQDYQGLTSLLDIMQSVCAKCDPDPKFSKTYQREAFDGEKELEGEVTNLSYLATVLAQDDEVVTVLGSKRADESTLIVTSHQDALPLAALTSELPAEHKPAAPPLLRSVLLASKQPNLDDIIVAWMEGDQQFFPLDVHLRNTISWLRRSTVREERKLEPGETTAAQDFVMYSIFASTDSILSRIHRGQGHATKDGLSGHIWKYLTMPSVELVKEKNSVPKFKQRQVPRQLAFPFTEKQLDFLRSQGEWTNAKLLICDVGEVFYQGQRRLDFHDVMANFWLHCSASLEDLKAEKKRCLSLQGRFEDKDLAALRQKCLLAAWVYASLYSFVEHFKETLSLHLLNIDSALSFSYLATPSRYKSPRVQQERRGFDAC